MGDLANRGAFWTRIRPVWDLPTFSQLTLGSNYSAIDSWLVLSHRIQQHAFTCDVDHTVLHLP